MSRPRNPGTHAQAEAMRRALRRMRQAPRPGRAELLGVAVVRVTTSLVSAGKSVDKPFRLSVSARTIQHKDTTNRSAPGRSCNSVAQGPGRSNDLKGHDRRMAIMPVPTPSPLDATFSQGMSRADGCPECVLNVEPPRSSVALTNGFRNAYLCDDCGHAWTTDWRDGA